VETELSLCHAALIPPLLPTHLNLNMTFIRRTSGRRLAHSIKAAPFCVSEVHLYSASVGDFHTRLVNEFVPLVCDAAELDNWFRHF
jgi:hypothetical protein